MNILPMDDRVLIEILVTEQKSIGGIIIPQKSQEKTQEGIVLAIGESNTITVKIGDKIIFDKYSGVEIKKNDKIYLLIRIDDILAIID